MNNKYEVLCSEEDNNIDKIVLSNNKYLGKLEYQSQTFEKMKKNKKNLEYFKNSKKEKNKK